MRVAQLQSGLIRTSHGIAFVVTFLIVTSLAAAEPTFDDEGFRDRIVPLLTSYCVDCHGEDSPEAGLSLDNIKPDLLDGASLETWRLIDEQIRYGDMPPEDADQPSPEERKTLLRWLRTEMLKTQEPGVLTDEKLLLPQFGNYVDHHALFGERRSHVTPAKPRLWRLRPSIYKSIVPRLGERISGLANALNSLDGPDFKDYSAPYFLDEASTQQLLANAKLVAANLVAQHGKDRAVKALVSDDGPPSDAIVASALEASFRRAFGRGPAADEKERFLAFYQQAKATGGYKTAAQALMTAVILQPEFMFRQELGEGKPDEHGRVRLSQSEAAYALSYALSNYPLGEFTAAAGRGELANSANVAALVRSRLEDDSPNYDRNPQVMQFFREYFHYPFSNEVFKDTPDGGEHKPSALVADLEMTIKAILKEDRQVLRELLTTRMYFINVQYGRKQQANQLIKRDTKTRKYQTAFNLPLDWKWGVHLQPVSFAEDERAGVLTHPAWLAAWSGNFENHPVQRGKWIRTHLLGGSVPDVPIGVDARVPEKEHTTFRDRLKIATKAAQCWRCHRKMDPLGVPFERYDHYGRLQRFDAGQPVNVTGRISRTVFPELHREVSSPTELMEILADSEHVEQVFVRHVFRYFMGRNETLGDANTLQDAHHAYQDSNGSFNELVISLLSSHSFLLRQRRSSSLNARSARQSRSGAAKQPNDARPNPDN